MTKFKDNPSDHARCTQAYSGLILKGVEGDKDRLVGTPAAPNSGSLTFDSWLTNWLY
jgi:hypothetical protein